MAARARVQIYDSQIAGEFSPGGDVHRETVKAMASAKRYAIAYAPVRSGVLKASHHTSTSRRGAYQTTGTLWNDAEHAEYVSEGTDFPITATDPTQLMILRPGPNHPRPSGAYVVDGQPPNNWLERAVDSAIAPYL